MKRNDMVVRNIPNVEVLHVSCSTCVIYMGYVLMSHGLSHKLNLSLGMQPPVSLLQLDLDS